ncbi:hypothetical protein KUCAC02_034361 [Chaenocephalus aceratus]|nr:hypothetical protein KUCAC02_034361 [Chaenocephalus aceratus]
MLGVHVLEFKCCLKGIRFRAALSTECSQAPDPSERRGHHEPPPLRRGPRGGGSWCPLLSDPVREEGGTMSPLLSDGVREEGAP